MSSPCIRFPCTAHIQAAHHSLHNCMFCHTHPHPCPTCCMLCFPALSHTFSVVHQHTFLFRAFPMHRTSACISALCAFGALGASPYTLHPNTLRLGHLD